MNNLATTLTSLGDYAGAQKLQEEALSSYEQALGGDHPAIARSLVNLASLHEARGAFTEAVPLYQRALAIREKTLGPDHSDLVPILERLAAIYEADGRASEAVPLNQRALAIREKTLGPDRPDLVIGVEHSAFIAIPLKATDQHFYEADVGDDRWFGRTRWVLGVRLPLEGIGPISRITQLVKVCSVAFVPELVKRALPGLTLSPLETPPSAIALKVGSRYFSMERSGPCWEHIVRTRRVGIYFPPELPKPELELIVLQEG